MFVSTHPTRPQAKPAQCNQIVVPSGSSGKQVIITVNKASFSYSFNLRTESGNNAECGISPYHQVDEVVFYHLMWFSVEERGSTR